MSKKVVLLIILLLVLMYPVFSAFQVNVFLNAGAGREELRESLTNYQISIWVSWVVMAVTAVTYKWSKKDDFFFYFTYIFLLLAFSVFGYFVQDVVNTYDISSGIGDNYSFGVFTAIQNFGAAAILTVFLQAGVWWFTRRWHRR